MKMFLYEYKEQGGGNIRLCFRDMARQTWTTNVSPQFGNWKYWGKVVEQIKGGKKMYLENLQENHRYPGRFILDPDHEPHETISFEEDAKQGKLF